MNTPKKVFIKNVMVAKLENIIAIMNKSRLSPTKIQPAIFTLYLKETNAFWPWAFQRYKTPAAVKTASRTKVSAHPNLSSKASGMYIVKSAKTGERLIRLEDSVKLIGDKK